MNVRKMEAAFLNFLGFKQSTMQYMIIKGITPKFLLNHNSFSSTIFKDLKFVHHVKSNY